MPLERSAMAVPQLSAPAPSHESGVSFDERWAAWVAKGAARDRAFRRKLAVAAPIVIIVVAIIVFALLR
jgi:hypothetical protein